MRRLFVAIKIHPDNTFLEQLRQIKTSLRSEKIKWVEEYNIHITLKFLGETDEKKIPEIENALNVVAGQQLAFGISFKNLGIFGSRYNPRVIWVGIDPYDDLVILMQKIHQSLEPVGFLPDSQNLVPHLTLGRIKEIKDKILFQRIIDQFREISSVKMQVNNFILYESILKKEGPIYIVLKTFDLQKL